MSKPRVTTAEPLNDAQSEWKFYGCPEWHTQVKPLLAATREGAGPGKYYVYVLIDPRCGFPFYVGKGRNNRCKDHKREALEGRRGARYNVIREIMIAGLQYEVRKIKWFDDNRAALEYESKMIWTIGPKNLTNKIAGVYSTSRAAA